MEKVNRQAEKEENSQPPKIPVTYSARIFVPLNDNILRLIHGNATAMYVAAKKFQFDRMEDSEENSARTLAFSKANPLYQMIIEFEEKGATILAITRKPGLLRYFRVLAFGELSAILDNMRELSTSIAKSHVA